jgi:hypothetical protein
MVPGSFLVFSETTQPQSSREAREGRATAFPQAAAPEVIRVYPRVIFGLDLIPWPGHLGNDGNGLKRLQRSPEGCA